MTTLVPVELPEPPLGERMVGHDADFTAVDRGWSTLRDAINKVLIEKTGYGGIDDVYFTSFIIQ